MLLAEKQKQPQQGPQSEVQRMNCAGQACPERAQCRRYCVNVGAEWKVGTGHWGSFDIERKARGGECPSFKRIIG